MENFVSSKVIPSIATLMLSLVMCSTASASVSPFALDYYGFNIDGTVTLPGDSLPSSIDASSFDFNTGLGNIGITITGAGPHSFDAFFDHDIDEPINTFFNELGSTSGSPATGQSWEIDEPGLLRGDIDCNALGCAFTSPPITGSNLDNMIGKSIFGDTYFPDDVSMAMGWDFSLAQGDRALITLALADTSPLSGFFLEHNDPDSQKSIYLSSTLDISPIPVPAAIWLFGTGIAGLIGFSRRKRRSTR